MGLAKKANISETVPVWSCHDHEPNFIQNKNGLDHDHERNWAI